MSVVTSLAAYNFGGTISVLWQLRFLGRTRHFQPDVQILNRIVILSFLVFAIGTFFRPTDRLKWFLIMSLNAIRIFAFVTALGFFIDCLGIFIGHPPQTATWIIAILSIPIYKIATRSIRFFTFDFDGDKGNEKSLSDTRNDQEWHHADVPPKRK